MADASERRLLVYGRIFSAHWLDPGRIHLDPAGSTWIQVKMRPYTRSRSSDASAMESAASAPQPDDNAQTVFAAIPGEDLHSEPTQREAGLLGALRAACSIANVRFTDTMTANELLVSLLAKRDPSRFPQDSSQHYSGAQHPSHGGGVRANFLREESEDHNIDGK